MDYQIKNEYLNVNISSHGGELKSIKTSDEKEWLWQGDKNTWEEQAPNLFPYIARLTQGTYTYQNCKYKMKIHGFVKYMDLNVFHQEESRITFLLESNKETKSQYPFEFQYLIHYQLNKNTLEVCYEVNNKDSKEMIFGLGGHPGFRVPWDTESKFTDYYLEFEHLCSPKRIGFTEDCFVNEEIETYSLRESKYIDLSHNLFDRDAIVLKEMCSNIFIKSTKGNSSIQLTFPDFSYLGLWHWPRKEADYICIEPWSSLPSRAGIIEDLETQEDLIHVPANQNYKAAYSITVNS